MTHLFTGAIFIALGAWGMWAWWPNFGLVMRGLLPLFLLASGLLALASSYYRMTSRRDDVEEPR